MHSTELRDGARVALCFSVLDTRLCFANQANMPRVCLVRKASSYIFTEDWKICSPFPEQFDVFYQREVKEKENRTGASGEFQNGCPK